MGKLTNIVTLGLFGLGSLVGLSEKSYGQDVLSGIYVGPPYETKLEKFNPELKKFNQDNEKVYEDFLNFMEDNGKNYSDRDSISFNYSVEFGGNSYNAYAYRVFPFDKDKRMKAIKLEKNPIYSQEEGTDLSNRGNFWDKHANGFREGEDEYGAYVRAISCFPPSQGTFLMIEELCGFSSKQQLEIAEEYTNSLKEIMHNEGVPGY